MLNLLFTYWLVVLPAFGVAAFFVLRFWAERKFDSVTESILRETQSLFAEGNVEIHSATFAGTKIIDDETATLYDIDATITPSDGNIEWSGADLFLRGVDDEGGDDPLRIGEIRHLQRWNGSSFEPYNHRAKHVGIQRLLLSIRYAGSPGPARFNYNFASFGPAFDLPQAEEDVLATM
jgi:hypothetical protein